MRRLIGFVALVVPALAWLPVRLWLQSHVDEWQLAGVELPLWTRVLLSLDNFSVRWGVLVVLAAVVAMPLLGYLASFAAASEPRENRRGVLAWVSLASFFWLVPIIAARVDFRFLVWSNDLLDFAGTISYAFALGCAYALLRQRPPRRLAWLRSGSLLWGGLAALLVGGGLAVLLPGAVWVGSLHDNQ